jgi:hypothetical protein
VTSSTMRISVLVLMASLLCGCVLQSNVNTRKAGQPWHYYGYLRDFYRDENHGGEVPLVWFDQVGIQEVPRADYQKAIQFLIPQGFRKIGSLSILTSSIVDPSDLRRLAADQGARIIVACSFPVANERGIKPVITNVQRGGNGLPEYEFALPPANIARTQYWYQFLTK